MGPNFRNSNRRQNRTGYVDHDVFEGLPVRHWRRDYVTVAPPPTQENTASQNDIWAIELPHGMPKDSHLLPQHSQDLLRAARSGRIYKRPAPVEEEEADPEVILGDKPEKKEDDARDKGFTAKAWKQIPRHMEGPDVEYLAKRRKGLVTLSKATAAGPTLTKATVRKIDAAGNPYTQDVIVPKGQQVEGEVISTTTIPDPAAAEGFAQPTPPKRKGAPPKHKKMKGPGRGRKKKPVAPTSVPESVGVDGLAQSVEGTGTAPDSSAIKTENETENGNALQLNHEDTEMGEGSMAASDDEGGEDGDDGDEGDDDEGSVSAQDSPSKPPRTFSPGHLPYVKEIPGLGSKDTDMSDVDDLPGPPLPKLETVEEKSGSPLKNVALSTSNITSPIKSPDEAQDILPSAAPVPDVSNESATAEITALDAAMQQEVAETVPSTIPLPPPEPTMTEVISAVEERQEEEEEEEMLLDIMENTKNAHIGAPEAPAIAPAELPVQEPAVIPPEPQPAEAVKEEPQESEAPAPVPEPVVEQLEEQQVEEDADFPDLLGGLEEQLKEPQAEAEPQAATTAEPTAVPLAVPLAEPPAEIPAEIPVSETTAEEGEQGA